jgi:hypothetical protein
MSSLGGASGVTEATIKGSLRGYTRFRNTGRKPASTMTSFAGKRRSAVAAPGNRSSTGGHSARVLGAGKPQGLLMTDRFYCALLPSCGWKAKTTV